MRCNCQRHLRHHPEDRDARRAHTLRGVRHLPGAVSQSNSAYLATDAALAEVERSGNLPVPLHLRNAPTKLMKSLDYGKNYLYAHDYPAISWCSNPPDSIATKGSGSHAGIRRKTAYAAAFGTLGEEGLRACMVEVGEDVLVRRGPEGLRTTTSSGRKSSFDRGGEKACEAFVTEIAFGSNQLDRRRRGPRGRLRLERSCVPVDAK